MMQSLSRAFFTVLMVSGLILVGTIHFVPVQASTDVTGIINSDITWTKANSPYVFTGAVGVGSGVTLTIEPGVTVNIGSYYLQVSGTLDARGSNLDNIVFISETPSYGNIAFTDSSTSWNEQIGSGCIIENAVLDSTSISMNEVSPKINNNTIIAAINVDGSSAIITNNIIMDDIGVHSSSPTINNNSILGGINIGSDSPSGDSPVIANNTIEGGDAGNGIGINFEGGPYIADNVISGCRTGVSARGVQATIERNLIINNIEGIYVLSGTIQIRNNTIKDNFVAIRIRSYSPSFASIIYNNIENNSQNSIYLEDTGDVNASYNWWGTTDTQLIELTIHDNKNDFNVGTVTFTPFLTTPNTEAMPIPELPSWIILPSFLIATLAGIIFRKRLTKKMVR